MPVQPRTRTGSRAARLLLVLQWCFLLAAAGALSWCALIVSDAWFAQQAARHTLETSTAPDERAVLAPGLEELEAGSSAPAADADVATGSVIGVLTIPRVQLSAAVLHGSDARTLSRGPGHVEQTAFPGEPGNVAIAGHRDTFFRPLRNIRVGDDIFLETPKGQFRYRVTWLRVVKPRDVSVLNATEQPTLTLITCYPFWVLGHAPDRFIVRAVRVDAPSPTAEEARMVEAIRPAAEPVVDIPAPVASSVESAFLGHRSSKSEGGRRTSVSAPRDDESLVRQTVHRYLARVGEADSLSCQVRFGGSHASVDCDPGDRAASQDEARGRLFGLERTEGTWAIRSVAVK